MHIKNGFACMAAGLLFSSLFLFSAQSPEPITTESLEEDFAKLAFELDLPVFAGLHSISAMRAVVERDFNKEDNTLKDTVTEPPIPWDNLEDTIGDYLWLCQKHKQGKGLFVEKKYVARSTILALGDLHGSIYTLLDTFDDWIGQGLLYDDYTLAPSVHVVVLGDYVDRGQGGIEVLCMLLRLKIKNWSQVTIIRGNHENWAVNEMFNFVKELGRKYPRYLWALREDPKLDNSNFIPRIYNTLPVATFLAGGKNTAQENLSYVLCTHGMVDETLAAETKGILAQKFSASGQETLTFANTAQHKYVTDEVAWGDIAQYINPDVTFEEAYRVTKQAGRLCANQPWLEENFLKLYPTVKLIIRGHQHFIADGVLFTTKAWIDLQMELPGFYKSSVFSKPYPQGPFSFDAVQAVAKTYASRQDKPYSFEDYWGKVLTTSAAHHVDPHIKLSSVTSLLLRPGPTPKASWDIQIRRPRKAPVVVTAPSKATSVGPDTLVVGSASSSSATTSSARSA